MASLHRCRRAWWLLCLLFGAGPGAGQVVDLAGVSPPAALELGDTLVVGIGLHSAGHRLTSVGLSLAYDPAVLRPVADAEEVFAVDLGFFAGAEVWANRARLLADGSARAQLIAVSGRAVGAERRALIGDGVLARIAFRVVGAADSVVVDIVTAGGQRPVYTELGRPGLEGDFAVGPPRRLAVALDPGGFLSLEDVHVDAGRVAALALTGRAAAPLTWTVTSRDPRRVTVRLAGDSLLLVTRPRRAGVVRVDYRAAEAAGVSVGRGSIAVEARAAALLLADPGLRFSEDFGSARLDLGRFLAAAPPPDARWKITVSAPLTAALEDTALALAAPRDWSGNALLTLLLTAGRDRLDSLALPVVVEAVDDPPLVLSTGQWVIPAGVPTPGPRLQDLVADVDDDLADLRFDLRGDGIEAWLEAGRLWLRGTRVGTAVVDVAVTDPEGGQGRGRLDVRVERPGTAPILRLPQGVALSVPGRWAGALRDLVSDLDTDTAALSWQVHAPGDAVTAWVAADSLVVRATAAGSGLIQVEVVDPEGNTASARWLITVDPGAGHGSPESGATDLPEASTAGQAPGAPPASATEPVLAERVTPPPSSPSVPGPDRGPPPSASLRLALPAPWRLAAGSIATLDVAALVAPAGAGRVFSVTGATFVDARIDADGGTLRLRVPAGSAGREVLLVTVTAIDGARATATLEVLVTAPVESLRLRPFAPLRLAAGDSARVDLASQLVSPSDVRWRVEVPATEPVTARVDGDDLSLRALADRAGRAAVLVIAEGPGGQRASELLSVQVDGRLPAAADATVRVEVPDDVDVTPGGSLTLDLDSLVSSPELVTWRVVAAADLEAGLRGDRLEVKAPADATAGWRRVVLEAWTPSSASVTVIFRVAVTPPPPQLVLRALPRIELAAGAASVVGLDPLVSVGQATAVHWSVAGGLLVRAGIVDRRLHLDGELALPGREVFDLTARLGSEQRRASLAVRVRAPRVVVAVPSAGIAAAGDTSVDVDVWVAGEVEARRLHWEVRDAPPGLEAVWDVGTRRLRLSGSGAGELSLRARLGSGLQVADAVVPVRLGKPTASVPPSTPAPREQDRGASTLPAHGDGTAASTWSLRTPVVAALEAGVPRRLPLATLVSGLDATTLTWSTSAPEGAAWVDGDDLVLLGSQSFSVLIQARSVASNLTRSTVLVVPVTLPDPPPVRLEWELRESEGGVWIAVTLTAASGVDLSLEVGGPGRRALRRGVREGEPVLVALPKTPAILNLVAEGRFGGRHTQVQQRLRAGVLAGGEALLAAGGTLRLELPAGAGGPVGVAVAGVDEGGYRVLRQGGSAPLLLRWHGVLDAGILERRRDGVWEPSPTAWGETRGDDLVAALPGPAHDGVYRVVAGAMARRTGWPFPNPFNAEVTLPVSVGQAAWVEVFDSLGRRVRQLPARSTGAVIWDGRDALGHPLASGVYFYRLDGADPSVQPPAGGRVTLVR